MSTGRPRPTRRRATSESTGEEQVSWQRERLFAAIADEVAANGYADASVEAIAARAGLSLDEFHLHFADKEQCFLAAFESLVQQLAAHTLAAYRNSSRDWRGSIGTALAVLVRAMCTRPSAVRAYMIIVDVGSVSERARASRDQALVLFASALSEMIDGNPGKVALPSSTVTGMVGGIWRLIEARMREDRAGELVETVDGIVAWVLSYLACEEQTSAHGGVPAAAAGTALPAERELTVELTYGAVLEMLARDEPQRPEDMAFAALAPIVGAQRASLLRKARPED
jgi:AcrR family transcriptional regulator